jgi:tRNA (Thr-GGU) A37 N-methylase
MLLHYLWNDNRLKEAIDGTPVVDIKIVIDSDE